MPSPRSSVGSEPIELLADRIRHSVGPSGRNIVELFLIVLPTVAEYLEKDYFYALSNSVRQLAPESRDSHLEAIEVGCHEIQTQKQFIFTADRKN